MAEVQDEEQWLYGDDKSESPAPENENKELEKDKDVENKQENKAKENNKEPAVNDEAAVPEQNGETQKPENDEDSSSDDEPMVTIGKIVKQPDIIRPPPPPTHRSAPTSGLKDEDFSSVGKINGISAVDYNLMELEEKPWRKPGADLSDYFNYGFTEDTWLQYCERQKAIRTNESGIGLTGLGINLGKSSVSLAFGQSNIPVTIVNENSKYGSTLKKFNFPPPQIGTTGSETNDTNNSQGNTIQVMTAERRTYSNKVMNNPGYDDMDFGGGGGYGAPPDPNFFTTPPPQAGTPFFSQPPPIHTPSWSVPPPSYGAPPPVPVPPPVNYFEEESHSQDRISKDIDLERHRSVDHRESRHRESSRRRSRSRSRSRHAKRRSRSRSRSPSHRHKRKKTKRDRDERERSKSR